MILEVLMIRGGGSLRSKASYKCFKEMIEKLEMDEIAFHGRGWTWANNWDDD